MKRGLGLAAVAVVLGLVGLIGAPRSLPAMTTTRLGAATPSVPAEIGAGPVGEPSIKFVGTNEYRASAIALYGYLRAVIGADQTIVFTDQNVPSESSARFTYAGEAAITGRDEGEEVSQVRGSGTLTIYFNDRGGASFSDPASFSRGTPVAVAQLLVNDTLERTTSGLLVAVGEDELAQVSAEPFAFGGERYRFGHAGVQERLLFTGSDTRVGTLPTAATIGLAGSIIVTDRGAQPPAAENLKATPVGEAAASPEASRPVTPVVVASPRGDCATLEPWLGDAVKRAGRVAAIAGEIPENATSDSLDADELRRLASELSELSKDQRAAEAPDAAAAINRLLVTAFSTDKRGLSLLATAVADRDDAVFAQGQTTLHDGNELLARANGQLSRLSTGCGTEIGTPQSGQVAG